MLYPAELQALPQAMSAHHSTAFYKLSSEVEGHPGCFYKRDR